MKSPLLSSLFLFFFFASFFLSCAQTKKENSSFPELNKEQIQFNTILPPFIIEETGLSWLSSDLNLTGKEKSQIFVEARFFALPTAAIELISVKKKELKVFSLEELRPIQYYLWKASGENVLTIKVIPNQLVYGSKIRQVSGVKQMEHNKLKQDKATQTEHSIYSFSEGMSLACQVEKKEDFFLFKELNFKYRKILKFEELQTKDGKNKYIVREAPDFDSTQYKLTDAINPSPLHLKSNEVLLMPLYVHPSKVKKLPKKEREEMDKLPAYLKHFILIRIKHITQDELK